VSGVFELQNMCGLSDDNVKVFCSYGTNRQSSLDMSASFHRDPDPSSHYILIGRATHLVPAPWLLSSQYNPGIQLFRIIILQGGSNMTGTDCV
jgi:hypothetical protein